ncbi:MAG: YbgC/FadM family acyl-CoA thioesterase [Alphaproteobacteria bacterium]|nr:YbgC/FadM family acyl-CoA thioesterase [Alphaproteobacteria bacterium]
MKHSYKVRVYYQDTDAGGIVYHSKYLDFAERARSELLVEMGVSNKRLIEEEGVAFVLSSASIQYKSPARLDDVIEVQTKVKEIKNASMVMEHKFLVEGALKVLIELKLAVINPKDLRPIRIKENLKNLFMKYYQENEENDE